MRLVSLVFIALITACGGATASSTKPSPSPTPTPDVGALYTNVINVLHDSVAADSPSYYASSAGSAAASAAAKKLADDYQTLLDGLDTIPFPPAAQADLSGFKKSVVALQVFWSNVSIDDNSYSDTVAGALTNDYNNEGILLGHDVGVSLVLQKPSPTPS